MNINTNIYLKKDKKREPDQHEKNVLFHVFIHDKKSVPELSKLFNLTIPRIEKVLFAKGNHKPYNVPGLKGIIGFAKKTAYWETEQELIDSFNPVYRVEDLKGWEKDAVNTRKAFKQSI